MFLPVKCFAAQGLGLSTNRNGSYKKYKSLIGCSID